MAKRKKDWKIDDRVTVEFDNEPFKGSIIEFIGKAKARILFDDGDVHIIHFKKLEQVKKISRERKGKKESRTTSPNVGFNQHNIKWDKDNINFTFKAENGKFYGWWRKTAMADDTAYAIDLHVEYNGHRYNVDTLSYLGTNPLDDIYSLNADICAAANKWFYYKCEETFDTIEQLKLKADKPTITLRRLESIDNILIRLREFRDTAIRSGGFRCIIMNGDDEKNDPSGGLRIQIDLTSQALGLNGRVPRLLEGGALDDIGDGKKSKKGHSAPRAAASKESVDILMKQLKKSTDKTEKRKIRAKLRKMGIHGGTRGNKNKGE